MVEHGRQQIYDKERVHWNTAWMKTHGEHFEVVINPDEALAYKRTEGKADLRECLRSEEIFADAKKGLLASDDALIKAFGTADSLEVAKKLILKGEIQLAAEHRQRLQEEKRNRLLERLHAFAIDPTTGNPHPRKRIELAMEEAKVKVDYNKDIESQLPDIVKKLQPVIPIRLETVTLQVHLPAPYGQKHYGDLERYGTIKKTDWLNDGGLLAYVEIPAGLQNDFADELNSKTHGGADFKKTDDQSIL